MKNFISNLFKKKQNNTDEAKPSKKSKSGIKGLLEKYFKKRLGNKAKGEDVVAFFWPKERWKSARIRGPAEKQGGREHEKKASGTEERRGR